MLTNSIILSESANFPWGMAATNRVKNLAKGLMSSQYQVEYLGLRGADVTFSQDKRHRGVFQGIRYVYPGRSAVRSTNWCIRRLDDVFGTLMAIHLILLRKITNKLDLVILYSRNYGTLNFWISFLHLLHIPVVLEVCEWPLAIAETENQGVKQARKICFSAIPKADGVLPISSYIEREIQSIAKARDKNIPSFKIPILIDIAPDQVLEPPKNKADYLLYGGAASYMNIAYLVVDTLLELRRRGLNLTVKITGRWKKKYFVPLQQYAADKGVLHRLEFTGFLDEDTLYSLMREALALLAPLPETVQSEARFSTKLGYYLASGTPVVTNAIGDVGFYLQDGVNGFVTENFNSGQIATKIEQIANDPSTAAQIGRNGQQLAVNTFHYSSACKGLDSFLHNLIEKYN